VADPPSSQEIPCSKMRHAAPPPPPRQPPAKSAEAPASEPSIRTRSFGGVIVWGLSIAGLTLLAIIAVMPFLSADEWWGYTVLCYFPRLPLLLPPAALLVASGVRRQWWCVACNAVSMALVAGPIMGLTVGGWRAVQSGVTDKPVRVLTSNIQGGESRLYSLLLEIRRARPDVILMQEVTPRSVSLLEDELADWQGISVGEFWIAARERPHLLAECQTSPFERKTAVACEVSVAGRSMTVVSLHLTTVRWGLEKLLGGGPTGRSRIQVFQEHEALRDEEARQTRAWVRVLSQDAAIIGGDFNTTPQCRLYTAHWSGLKNAFTEAGVGYGYTARCDDPAYWPANTPWVRIDHLVYGAPWQCVRVGRGATAGSDHRLVWGDFRAPADAR
jgi:vancomycin resistance protein VanJ